MYSGDRLRELKRNYGDFSEINKCAIAEALLDADILVPVKRFGVPDVLVDHAEPNESKTELGLTNDQIAERVLQAFFKQQVSAVV